MKPLALVVENDSGTRKLLDVLLSRVGLEVDLVPTGSDALIVLQHVHYDVILLDLLLPGKSGLEILSWLAEEQPHMLARAVVLSSASPAQLDAVRERWPEVRTIRKPFELGEVLEVTQSIAATREPRTPSAVEKFCRVSIRAGAKAGVIVRSNGANVEPLLWFGYTKEMVDGYFPVSVDAPYPLCATLRDGKPLWIASVVMATPEYPMLAPVWEQNASRALASVPMHTGGRIVGAAGWTFREPRLFSDAERQLLTDIADAIPEWLALEPGQSPTTASA
jgi:CheY-like chemotaxis protein